MALQANNPGPAADGTVRKAHYGDGEQPWDAIKRLGWAPEFAAGNVLKYLRRVKDPDHSLESARWYFTELRALMNRSQPTETINHVAEVFRALMRELTDAELKRLS